MSLFPTNILLATDGSESAGPARRAAADISATTGSQVHLIYVGKDVPKPANYDDPSAKDQEAIQKARDLLDGEKERIEAEGGKVANAHVIPGKKPAQEIVKFTRERDIGLIVVGSRGLGRLQYARQGSVSAAVVQNSYCPVLVVHGDYDF